LENYLLAPFFAPFRTKRKTATPKNSGLIMFLSYNVVALLFGVFSFKDFLPSLTS